VPLSSRALQYLNIALLAGLGTNALLGRWWTDPIAGLAVAAVAFREGLAGWRGQADASALLVGAGPAARSVPGRRCGCRRIAISGRGGRRSSPSEGFDFLPAQSQFPVRHR
jgi:hypothetical protein